MEFSACGQVFVKKTGNYHNDADQEDEGVDPRITEAHGNGENEGTGTHSKERNLMNEFLRQKTLVSNQV